MPMNQSAKCNSADTQVNSLSLHFLYLASCEPIPTHLSKKYVQNVLFVDADTQVKYVRGKKSIQSTCLHDRSIHISSVLKVIMKLAICTGLSGLIVLLNLNIWITQIYTVNIALS